MEKSIRPFMVILIVLLSIVISSGATYLFVENESNKEEQNLQNQINSLESQLSILKNSTSSAVSNKELKTYKNEKYKITFKYPSDKTISVTDKDGFLKVKIIFNSTDTYTLQVPIFDGGIEGASVVEMKTLTSIDGLKITRTVFKVNDSNFHHYLAFIPPTLIPQGVTLMGTSNSNIKVDVLKELDSIIESAQLIK